MGVRQSRIRVLGAAAACIGAVVLVAGCGGDGDNKAEAEGNADAALSSHSTGGMVQAEAQDVKSVPAGGALEGQATQLSINGTAMALRSLNQALKEHGNAPEESAGAYAVGRLAEPAIESNPTAGGVQSSVGLGAALRALDGRLDAQRSGETKQSAGVQTAAGLTGGITQASSAGGAQVSEAEALTQLEQKVAQAGNSSSVGGGVHQSDLAIGEARKGVAPAGGGVTGPGKESATQTIEPKSAVGGAVASEAVSGTPSGEVSEDAALAKLQQQLQGR